MKYLIDFYNHVTDEQIDAYVAEYGYTFLQEWSNFDKIVQVEADSEPVKTDLIQFVICDEENLIQPKNYGEVSFDPHWGKNLIPGVPTTTFSTSDVKDWWKNYVLTNPEFSEPTVTISRKGQNISVYVMDSGVKSDLPEFDGVDITNIYTVTPGDYSDNGGHGTALASIISGKTCGLTNAKIKNVKIFRHDRGTYQSEFLSALDAIISDFNNNSLAVVNCSWSIPRNTWIEEKMRAMTAQGIIIVAAAGNDGSPIGDVTPAAMDEAITIGSYNSDLLPSSFSDYTGGSHLSYEQGDTNHGELDAWAPGEGIWTVQLSGSYAYMAGTSAAAAVASTCLAWNLSQLADDDGIRYPEYNHFLPYNSFEKEGTVQNLTLPHSFYLFCAGKANMLDLSDPKYQDSINAIVTLKEITINVPYERTEITFIAKVGKPNSGGRVFDPHTTTKVEIIEPLPANFNITRDGKIHATPTADQGPDSASDQKFVETQSILKVTKQDGSDYNVTIKSYILAEDYVESDLPEDHEINITMLATCGRTLNTCFGFGPAQSPCLDNCSMVFYCCGSFKNDSCYCGMFG